jgi:hypothetical protein
MKPSNNKMISVRISESLLKRLKNQEQTISEIIRFLLESHLSTKNEKK